MNQDQLPNYKKLPQTEVAQNNIERVESVKQVQNPEGKYLKAREVILNSRLTYQQMFQKNEITADKFGEKMGLINDALLRLNKIIESNETKVQVIQAKNIENKAIGEEITTVVENIVDEEQTETKLNSVEISNKTPESSLELQKRPEYKQAIEVTAQNLARLAEQDPNAIAYQIQDLTGITLDAGQLLNSENDPANKAMLEYISNELMKNFDLRIQNPDNDKSFMFVVLDTEVLSVTQKRNLELLKNFAITPEANRMNKTVKNYSAENKQNRVISFIKEPVEIGNVEPVRITKPLATETEITRSYSTSINNPAPQADVNYSPTNFKPIQETSTFNNNTNQQTTRSQNQTKTETKTESTNQQENIPTKRAEVDQQNISFQPTPSVYQTMDVKAETVLNRPQLPASKVETGFVPEMKLAEPSPIPSNTENINNRETKPSLARNNVVQFNRKSNEVKPAEVRNNVVNFSRKPEQINQTQAQVKPAEVKSNIVNFNRPTSKNIPAATNSKGNLVGAK